jgi:diguanylate cyclase (GGDEF)-like protein
MTDPRITPPTAQMAQQGTLADVVRWQGRLRVLVGLLVLLAGIVVQRLGGSHVSLQLLAGTVLAYGVATVMLVWLAHRGVAQGWVAAGVVLSDLGLVFGGTIATSTPAYYHRVLLWAFLVVHLAEFYFGRKQALLALWVVVTVYTSMVSVTVARGTPLSVPDELTSVVLFAVTTALFIMRYGNLRNRLGTLVNLFERAEEGDFTREYDVSGDRRPDAITLVGRAYNRFRSQLASLVLTDPLTGCLNRRGFDQALAREVARADRAGSEVTLLALDLDHFKQVNDTYGHLAGDAVLFEAGALLLHSARGGDVVARTGGEEFSILLPDTSAGGAYQLASRICDTFRAHDFVVGDQIVRLTVSIGIVTATATAGDADPATLKRRADEALYAAKRGGRDRVRVWTVEPAREPTLSA